MDKSARWLWEIVIVNGEVVAAKQIEVPSTGPSRRYWWQHLEDDTGMLTDQSLEIDQPGVLSGRRGHGTRRPAYPRSCMSAERMLGFVTPPDVSKSFTGTSTFTRGRLTYLKTRNQAGTHRCSRINRFGMSGRSSSVAAEDCAVDGQRAQDEARIADQASALGGEIAGLLRTGQTAFKSAGSSSQVRLLYSDRWR
ncbi:hypothetical protein [Kibdelosporangium aridum]|uniref:hypothetical protein n=1 Tax=Kibdelosporangium aridum TaxID=2030 RepID=UPI0005693147|nr:hypothetical protein [Kibdelosporangium aridum]